MINHRTARDALAYIESESMYLVLKVLGTPQLLALVRKSNHLSNSLREEIVQKVERLVDKGELATETELAQVEVKIRTLKTMLARIKADEAFKVVCSLEGEPPSLMDKQDSL